MEQEQFFIFVVYDLNGFSQWKNDNLVEYRTTNYQLTRIAKIKGIATDYIKHKRVKIDFDPIGLQSAWVVVAEVTQIEKNLVQTRNHPVILSVEKTEQEADDFVKRMENGEIKFLIQKNEQVEKIYKILLPLIDD